MKMFQFANSIISSSTGYEEVKLYQYAGQENINGLLEPFYKKEIELKTVSQIEGYEKINYSSGKAQSVSMRRFYFNQADLIISSLNNNFQKGGDIIERFDKSLWYITEIIDSYYDTILKEGYICVKAYLQSSKEIKIIDDPIP